MGDRKADFPLVSNIGFLSSKREPQLKYAPLEKPLGRELLLHKTLFVSLRGDVPT